MHQDLIAPAKAGASAVSFLPNTLRDINRWISPGEFVLDSSIARYRADALIKNGMPQEAEFLLTLLHREELDSETLLLSDNELIKTTSRWFQRARELTATLEQIRASTKKPTRGLAKKTLLLREAIIESFHERNPPFTVRQMYYQMVSKDQVPKTEAGYRQVQNQLLKMRRDGSIPYSWIADNTRWMRKPETFRTPLDILRHYQKFYRQDAWHRRPIRVEFWCESDAIASALYEVTEIYDVPLYPCKGYSSETFAYEAIEAAKETGKPTYAYYLGDFDPSGWDMSASLKEKLMDSGLVYFQRIGVNLSQIKAWNLPIHETKETDSRFKRFFETFPGIDDHGVRDCASVEIDAVPPDILRNLVQQAIAQHIDPAELAALDREEDAAKEAFNQMLNVYQEVAS